MKIELYLCDICKKQFKEQKNVEGSISVINGNMISYDQVCKKCIREIIKVVESLEPELKN